MGIKVVEEDQTKTHCQMHFAPKEDRFATFHEVLQPQRLKAFRCVAYIMSRTVFLATRSDTMQ